MSWDEQVLDRDAKPVICMELLLDDETLYFSDTAMAEDDKNWIGLIEGMGSITRAVDPISKQCSVSDVSVALRNYLNEDDVSWWRVLDQSTDIENRVVNIYVKFKESDNTYSSKKVYSGLISRGSIVRKQIHVNIVPRLVAELPLLQRQINNTDFPNAPAESIGSALPVVIGNSDGELGSILGIMVDDDGGGTEPEIAFASHKVHAIEDIYRERDGTINPTPLTVVTEYETRLFQFDESGNAYSSIVLKNPSGHTAGDRYWGHIHGMCNDRHYVTLNGTSQYLTLADDPDFDIDDDITIQCRFRADSITGGLKILEGKTSATTGARLAQYNDQLRFYVGGESSYIETDNADLEADVFYIATGTFKSDGSIQNIYLRKEEGIALFVLLTTTRTGAVPTQIGLNNSQLRIGADRTGGNKFDGDVELVVVKPSFVTSGDELLPKPNVAGYWHFAGDYTDQSGNNHTLSATGSPTFTSCILLENPAAIVEGLLTNRSTWNLNFEDLDSDDFIAAFAECAARGYDVTGSFGGPIGNIAAKLQGEGSQWNYAQLIASNFDFQLYITLDGLIGIKTIDVSTLSTSQDLVIYDQAKGDFSKDIDLKLDQKPWKRVNTIRAPLKYGQGPNQFESFVGAINQLSIDKFKLSPDSSWEYQFIRAKAMTKDVLGRQLTLRSGNTEKIPWTVPGLWGLQEGSDIGDIVKLKTDGYFGSNYVVGKQVIITSVSANLLAGTVSLSGLSVGDTVGTIAFDAQETESITAVVDTFIKFDDPNTAFGTSFQLQFGHNFQSVVDTRNALRFDLRNISGSAIISAVMQTHMFSFFDDVQPTYVFRQLDSTLWSEASTFNNFDGSPWNDSLILLTDLTDDVGVNIFGDPLFTFNAAGLAYLTAQIGGFIELSIFKKTGDDNYAGFISSREDTSQAALITLVHE